jgi:2,4-dienoyl-CoA reductase-like NADH-dependent reductase (Old Yellow Enzyme family)
MARIFTPWKMGSLELPNRLVRSATWEGTAEASGAPSDRTIKLTAGVAAGGVGLTIVGYAYVHAEGLGMPRQTGADDDALIPSLSRLAAAAHDHDAAIAIQIAHAGGNSRPRWMPGREKVFGPSALTNPVFECEVEEMSVNHICRLVDDFREAAGRSKKAGFDAIQLHAAHGYLLNQFLSPERNLRNDGYGGSPARRARFVFEVYEAVRGAVGNDYPVFIKLNCNDATENGLRLAEAVEVAAQLDRMGIDAIEVSGGAPGGSKNSPIRSVKDEEAEGYFFEEAKAVKNRVKCPVISVGGWRTRRLVEEALERVDAVAMARPFIREPDLARRWEEGRGDRAACVSCMRCLRLAFRSGVACAQEIKEHAKKKGGYPD